MNYFFSLHDNPISTTILPAVKMRKLRLKEMMQLSQVAQLMSQIVRVLGDLPEFKSHTLIHSALKLPLLKGVHFLLNIYKEQV